MAPTTRNTDRSNGIDVPVNDQAESSNANVNMTLKAMAQFFRAMFASMGNMPPLPLNQPALRREADRIILFANFRKLNPSTFKGNTTAQVAESWLRQVKRLLETIKIQLKQDKIALVTIQMIDKADNWWNMI